MVRLLEVHVPADAAVEAVDAADVRESLLRTGNAAEGDLLSDNVVYSKLTLDVGPGSVAHVAHLMGITSPLQVIPSIGLGSNSVTPLTLASAYATVASGGVCHAPYAVRKVVFADGEVDRGHWSSHDVHRVLPPGVAWTVTKVLEANVREGTGVAAQLPGRHAAGKTGTTTS